MVPTAALPCAGETQGQSWQSMEAGHERARKALITALSKKHMKFQSCLFSCLAPCLETSPSNLPWIPAKPRGVSLCIRDFQYRKPLAESLLLLCGRGGHAPLLLVVQTRGTKSQQNSHRWLLITKGASKDTTHDLNLPKGRNVSLICVLTKCQLAKCCVNSVPILCACL